MLDPKLVGRSAMERTKLRYRTDVGLLGARRQIAHRHVVDHALAQRRDRPGHRKLLSNWTARTRSPRRQEGICRYPTPIEMSRGQKRKLWKRQAKTLKISKSTSSIWAPNAATGKLPRQRFSATDVMECEAEAHPYSALMLAALMIGHHLSISALWWA